tara:strand:- start:392 stop:916 length:525 start_codon:yes stop_codon:yes gene_type:complete
MIPNNFVFAEIGTFMGRGLSYFTVESLLRMKSGEIYAIDTFQGSEEHLNKNSPHFIPALKEDVNFLLKEYKKHTSDIREYITTIQNESTVAAKSFRDEYFDAIYLDGAHDYKSVLEDLESWYPKLKQDKILLFGDDWGWDTVRRAVEDFVKDKDQLKIFITEPNEYLITNLELN